MRSSSPKVVLSSQTKTTSTTYNRLCSAIMSSPRMKRLAREIAEVRKDSQSKLTVEPVGEQLDDLEATFPGPEGTVYEGGIFRLSIKADQRYPFTPLAIKFITKIYHPNISSQTGAICLSTLTAEHWSPVFTLRTAVLSVGQLLSSPEPSDPIDAQVAQVYNNNRAEFEATARFWTEVYANGPPSKNAAARWSEKEKKQIEQSVAMGFEKSRVEQVMKELKGEGDITDDVLVERLLG